jgi:hypothetical protein
MGPRVDGLLTDLAEELSPLRDVVSRIAVVDDVAVTDVAPRLFGQGPPIARSWPSATNGPAINRNRGAKDSSADWLVFLDDDVRLNPGWGDALRALVDDPDAGDLIGGRIGSQHPRNWFSQAAEDFVVRHREYPEGWYLAAAHLLVRRAGFEQLGGFDTRFAYGAEDWDLCRRAHAAGLMVGVTDAMSVAHANPRTWRQLRRKAEQYGAANTTFDSKPEGSPSVDEGQPATPSLEQDQAVLPGPIRGLRWASTEYSTLRASGRGRIRSLRTMALYIPWMVIYLRSQSASRLPAE